MEVVRPFIPYQLLLSIVQVNIVSLFLYFVNFVAFWRRSIRFLILLQVMSVREMLLCSHRKFMRSIWSSWLFFFIVSYFFDVSYWSSVFIFIFLIMEFISNRFSKVTRHGRRLGKRTIAGRVVKESYGAAKQQHTFTVGHLLP